MFWSHKWSVYSLPDLHGRVVIVTGGNIGLGAETCEQLAKKGATVYMGARSQTKAENAIKEIKTRVPKGDIRFLQIDLSDFTSVKTAAATFLSKEPVLDYLYLNAGMMGSEYAENKDGFEMQWATNFMGHWLLLRELIPILEKSAADGHDVRVISLSSNGHKLFTVPEGIRFNDVNLKGEAPMKRYGHTKLANILLANELAKRYPTIKAYSVHPGAVYTNLMNSTTGVGAPFKIVATVLMPLIGLNVHDGALTQLYCLSDDVKDLSGSFFEPLCKKANPSKTAQDPQLAKELWDWADTTFAKLGY